MTSITLTLTGAKAEATVKGTLTAGMAGIPVTITFDHSWDGLIKNLVCKSEPESCPIVNTTRTIINVENSAFVAHEVMREGRLLYLGVEGYRADGELIFPTTWAKCGVIHSSTDSQADPSADPTLPIWAQLQTDLNDIREQILTEDQLVSLMEPHLKNGFTEAHIAALDGMFKVCAFTKDDVSAEYAAFCTAFGIEGGDLPDVPDVPDEPDEPVDPEVTLTGISAAYSGGNVAVGTALDDLTGLVVTAHYSDGTSQTVTGYTLSGEIAEGENTITVSYSGMTTTFTVTGIPIVEKTWVSGTAYSEDYKIEGYAVNNSGVEYASDGATCSDYLCCLDADYLVHSQNSAHLHFYDVNKNWICDSYKGSNISPVSHVVPKNAVYARISPWIKVIPVEKAINIVPGVQEVTFTKGNLASGGNVESGSMYTSNELIPIGGAIALHSGADRIAVYDAHGNYILYMQSPSGLGDLNGDRWGAFSFIRICGYNGTVNTTPVIVFDASAHTVTRTLTDTTYKGPAYANDGQAYTGTITPKSGYEISSVTVTMGGVDVTETAYADGTISIENVTGDIVITAVAYPEEAG